MYVCEYVYMYVCMHACMYVCTYVCVHVCMSVCMHACMYVRNGNTNTFIQASHCIQCNGRAQSVVRPPPSTLNPKAALLNPKVALAVCARRLSPRPSFTPSSVSVLNLCVCVCVRVRVCVCVCARAHNTRAGGYPPFCRTNKAQKKGGDKYRENLTSAMELIISEKNERLDGSSSSSKTCSHQPTKKKLTQQNFCSHQPTKKN